MNTINLKFPAMMTQQILLFLLMGIFLGVSKNTNAGSMICELEIKKIENTLSTGNTTSQRVAEELSIETYLDDPALDSTWYELFNTQPNTSPDDDIILQSETVVTWPAGTLIMDGMMKIKVKTNRHTGLKEIKIKQVDSDEGITEFSSGSGGINPNIADGGWHEVEVESMDNVSVIIDGTEVIGFLKKLEIELDESSTVGSPVVKEFELKLVTDDTTLSDIKKDYVYSVTVSVPETTVTAIAGIAYEEETNEAPFLLGGHIEAEYERDEDNIMEGVLIDALLSDLNNSRLKEREGPCIIGSDNIPPVPPNTPSIPGLPGLF